MRLAVQSFTHKRDWWGFNIRNYYRVNPEQCINDGLFTDKYISLNFWPLWYILSVKCFLGLWLMRNTFRASKESLLASIHTSIETTRNKPDITEIIWVLTFKLPFLFNYNISSLPVLWPNFQTVTNNVDLCYLTIRAFQIF